jgi:catalase-peroxidase
LPTSSSSAATGGSKRRIKAAASNVEVPFTAGRGDATDAQTDADSFAPLEPLADGFRNWQKKRITVRPRSCCSTAPQLLGLTAPEMTALIGGLRVLGANHGAARHGHFTKRPGQLTNDFFVNLYRHDERLEVPPAATTTMYEIRPQERP